MSRGLRILLIASLISLALLRVTSNDARGKFWCWRVSGGDLVAPVLLSTEDCEGGLSYGNAHGIIQLTKSEIYYSLEITDLDGGNPKPMFRYYPPTSAHPAFMVVPQYEFGPDPIAIDSPYSGRDYGIWAPSEELQMVLERYIPIAAKGLISGRPEMFEVIGKAGDQMGGTVLLNSFSVSDYFQYGEGHQIDLTARFGSRVWDLLSQLRLTEHRSLDPGGLGRHPLDVLIGRGPALRLFYYPPEQERGGLIGKGYLYDVPEQLDAMFMEGLGRESGDRAIEQPESPSGTSAGIVALDDRNSAKSREEAVPETKPGEPQHGGNPEVNDPPPSVIWLAWVPTGLMVLGLGLVAAGILTRRQRGRPSHR